MPVHGVFVFNQLYKAVLAELEIFTFYSKNIVINTAKLCYKFCSLFFSFFLSFTILHSSLRTQNSLFEWVRDHRVHHKYTDTNADPHNALRGFFFSHVGWLLVKKHPDVAAKGKQLNFDDIYADKVVMFQHKYKFAFMAVFTFGIPFCEWRSLFVVLPFS